MPDIRTGSQPSAAARHRDLPENNRPKLDCRNDDRTNP